VRSCDAHLVQTSLLSPPAPQHTQKGRLVRLMQSGQQVFKHKLQTCSHVSRSERV